MILLPSTLKLPPEIVVPPPLFNVILDAPFWMLSISLRVELKEYVNCLPAWSNTMFLPALKVTVSPGLTFSELEPFVVPPLLAEVTFQPELLIA